MINKQNKQIKKLNIFIKNLMKFKKNEIVNRKITFKLLNKNEIILDYDLIKNNIEWD